MRTTNARTPRELFLAALDIEDSHERHAWLTDACAGDEPLRARVRRLLAADVHSHLQTAPATLPLLALMPSLDPWQHLPGSQVGAYRVENELGRGGMGAVFRAVRVDGHLEQEVAIKFLRRDLVDGSASRRFRLECEVMAHLQHPGIIRLLDTGLLADGTPYYVMDYVVGAPALAWCDEHRLDLRARLLLFLAICDAVSTAHRNLIVHRDLKSGNILVDDAGQPRLLDFGIAKALGGRLAALTVDDTATAQRFFSPSTAAPEQLRSGAITVACDVYALGMLLYELLSGLRPFELAGLSPGQVEEQILKTEPPAPSSAMHAPSLIPGEVEQMKRRLAARRLDSASQLARQLRGDLDAVVLRCLRKTPADRYASVEALASDVLNYVEGRAVSARNGARSYRLRKFIQRHRWGVAAATVGCLAIVATATGFARQARHIATERDRAEQVTGLLVQAFRSADPSNSLGANVSARDILDRSARDVAGELDTAPALRAELMRTLAEVNFNLDRHAQSRELLDQAQRTLDAAKVDDGPLRARIAAARGRNAVVSGDAASAARYLDEVLAYSPTPDLLTAVALDRARIDRDAGRYAAALAQIDAVIAGLPLDAVAQRRRLSEAHMLRADLLRLLDRKPEALADLESSLKWLATFRPSTHPDVINANLRLAELLRSTGQPQAALDLLHASRDAVTQMYGTQSPIVATMRNYEANALAELKRPDAAIDAYRDAFSIWSATLGEGHPNVAGVAFNLAQTLREAGQLEQADTWYRRSLEIAHQAWPPDHPSILLFSRMYSSLLIEQKQSVAALALLSGSIDAVLASDRRLTKGDLRGLALAVPLAVSAADNARARRYGDVLLVQLRERKLMQDPDFSAALTALVRSGVGAADAISISTDTAPTPPHGGIP